MPGAGVGRAACRLVAPIDLRAMPFTGRPPAILGKAWPSLVLAFHLKLPLKFDAADFLG